MRGTAAALAAMLAAVALEIENPYWAAMTALIVIQPTRGLLFEKSFYRLVGTVAGSAAGLLLLLHTTSPLLLTMVLALWVAACVGAGNLCYGLRSYAFLMAACTAPVIVLSAYQTPSHLFEIAFGRVACIIVGIIVATAVTALFTPRQSKKEVVTRVRRVAGETVAWLSLSLREGRSRRSVRLEQELLIAIAEIESLLDEIGAGSLRFKQRKRHIRSLVASLISLLAVGRLAGEQLGRHDDRDLRHGEWRKCLARHLDGVAARLSDSPQRLNMGDVTAIVAEARRHLPVLGETLGDVAAALQPVLTDCDSLAAPDLVQPQNRLVHHRDWREARRAAIRALLVIVGVGLIWSVSHWSKGPLMLMALAIMISIFSNKEHPAGFVGNIFIGAAIGSAVAIFCRTALLPGVPNPLLTGAIIAPFVLLGVLAMQYRRTAIAATDATLFFLFVSQPGVPVTIDSADLSIGAIAMVMGVGSAWLAYRYLVPVNPAIRMHSILSAILCDIAALVKVKGTSATEKLKARLHHRVIRLVAMATRYDSGHIKLVEGGMTALAIAVSIQRLRGDLAKGRLSPAVAREAGEILLGLSGWAHGHRAEQVPQILDATAGRIYALTEPSVPDSSFASIPPTDDGTAGNTATACQIPSFA